jgi:hypothetical protein
MANPISDLQALARAPLDAACDLAVIAQALQTLPEISAAVEPLPEAINGIRNIRVSKTPQRACATSSMQLTEYRRSRRCCSRSSRRLSRRSRTSDSSGRSSLPNMGQVTHIEAMVQCIERRSQVLERGVVDLQANADEAMRALPDPDGEQRGPLAKARDVITGG